MNPFLNPSAGQHIDYALSRATWLLIDWLSTMPQRMRREAEYRRAQALMESLSDHHLRDLGIRRSDIPLVVRGTGRRRTNL